MDAKVISFGEVEIDGQRFTHDVVVEGGEVRKRRKGPSKALQGSVRSHPVVGRRSDSLVVAAADHWDRRLRPAAGDGRDLRRSGPPWRRDRRPPDRRGLRAPCARGQPGHRGDPPRHLLTGYLANGFVLRRAGSSPASSSSGEARRVSLHRGAARRRRRAAGALAPGDLRLGRDPVTVRIGEHEWTTSLFPKDGGYLVPIKDAIRKAEAIILGG